MLAGLTKFSKNGAKRLFNAKQNLIKYLYEELTIDRTFSSEYIRRLSSHRTEQNAQESLELTFETSQFLIGRD
jgi:hypothetical protein